MSDIRVSLDRILPNPYQTRLPRPADDERVQALAADIAARGLLQVPLGRVVDANGADTKVIPAVFFLPVPQAQAYAEQVALLAKLDWYVQLAFGHNRLAAYKLLAKKDPGNGWDRLPVRLALLDDQAMALAAWSENEQRNDLSPLEKAQALQRLATDFNWTQEQVGKHCGLNRATVANKLRLLRLPEELQQKLHSGDLSERQALAVLPLHELPPAAQARAAAKAPYQWQVLLSPGKHSSDELRELVEQVAESATVPLGGGRRELGFPLAMPLAGAGIQAAQCTTCAQRRGQKQDDPGRCLDPDCFAAKTALFAASCLEAAAVATGLPVLPSAEWDKLDYYQHHEFAPWGNGNDGLDRARATSCANLHLIFRYNTEPWRAAQYPLRVSGHPHVTYACVNRDNHRGECCACARVGKQAAAAVDQAAQKQAARAAAERKEEAAGLLAAALGEGRTGGWKAVLLALDWSATVAQREKDRHLADPDTILRRIAGHVLEHTRLSWHDAQHFATQFAEWQATLGLELGQPDPQAGLHRRWARIHTWLDRLPREYPTAEAIRGNLENLVRLAADVGAVGDSGEGTTAELAAIGAAIQRARDGLQLLLPVVAENGADALTAAELRDAHCLLTVPSSDVNFKSSLEAGARVIGYARALSRLDGPAGHRSRNEALERRMRKLAREAGHAH